MTDTTARPGLDETAVILSSLDIVDLRRALRPQIAAARVEHEAGETHGVRLARLVALDGTLRAAADRIENGEPAAAAAEAADDAEQPLALVGSLLAWIEAPEDDEEGMSYLGQRSCADVVDALSADVAPRLRATLAAAKA